MSGDKPCLENKWYLQNGMGIDTSAFRQKYLAVEEEGPRRFWESDVTAVSSTASQTIRVLVQLAKFRPNIC